MVKKKIKIEGGDKSPLYKHFDKKPKNWKPELRELLGRVSAQILISEKEVFEKFDWQVTPVCKEVFKELRYKFREARFSISDLQTELSRALDIYVSEWKKQSEKESRIERSKTILESL